MRTGTEETQKSPPTSARMGGVRADFVANLGRRITELRHHWFNLDADRSSPRLRDEVRRRVHALGTRSRLLEFGAMADRLEDAERRLARSSEGGIDDADAAWFELLFVDLPALAWHEVGDQSPVAARSIAPKKPSSGPLQNAGALSSCVLFVGDLRLHRSFSSSQPPSESGVILEWECCERVDGAIELARALAPDLVLIDADIAGALDLTRALGRDPLTEPVPVMVLGSFSTPEQSAPFLVAGVVRALARPVSPDAVLDAVVYSLRAKEQHAPVEGFGDLTVEQVAQRLVDEIHFGLVDSVAAEAKGLRVPLGEGTEVLAAIWSAVARVRDTLTIRSKGQLRFSSRGPIGAVPMAPWLDSRSADDNAKREMSRGDADSAIRLDGRRILVVDDDPAITWFLSGLLRAHGATVFEARDGVEAFELACKASPELVISDILMPKLDGFGLCKALKRDVALRDVPVILLSWKEDLLQRLRELGADADGYLRKEASSTAIVRAVFEALRPRIRVEGRLRSGGEVRGRLDGLTARSLLQLVCGASPDAKVAIRDANHLYEIQVRSGVPRSALRVAQDGTTLRGASVFAHILSLVSGRFSVTPSSQVLTFDLEGDLITLLSEPIARARAGQLLLTGARLLSVQQVTLRRELLEFGVGPLPSNKILDALSNGVSPIELIRDEGIAPSLIELILNDASCRGAVLSVVGEDGADWMPSEIEQQLERLQPKDLSIRPPTTRRNSTIPNTKPYEQIIETAEEQPAKHAEFRFESEFPGSLEGAKQSADGQSIAAQDSEAPRSRSSDEPPTSLAEAVIRGALETHDGVDVAVSSSPTPFGDWNLRPRMSTRVESTRSFPQSLPPDAIVPAGEMSHPDLVGMSEPSIPAEPSIPPPASVRGFELLEAGYGERSLGKEDAEGIFETSTDCVSTLKDLGEHDDDSGEERVDSDLRDTGICPDSSDESRRINAVDDGDEPSGERRSGSMVPFLLTAVIIVGLVAAGLHFANRSSPELASGPVQASATMSAARVSDGGMMLPSMGTAPDVSDLPLPQGVRVGLGRGLLEIKTSSADAKVSVDGVVKGSGKRVSVEVEPGEHVVEISLNGQRGQRRAVTKVGRLTLVDAENLWPR